MAIGIYRIYNIVNDKSYIGKAVRLQYRINRHFKELSLGNHYNKHLQASYNKYGVDCFKYEIIKECIKEDCILEEIKSIKNFNSYDFGYNQTAGGEGLLGNKWSDVQTETMKKFMFGNKYGIGNKSHTDLKHSDETKLKIKNSLLGRKRGKYKTKIK